MTIDVAEGPGWTLYCGAWQDTPLADARVDALICDPPYSARTHEGMTAGDRETVCYGAWTESDVRSFAHSWSSRVGGWMVLIEDHILATEALATMDSCGRLAFAPVPFVEVGKQPRMQGDGPASWTCWIAAARPRSREWLESRKAKRDERGDPGSLPGAYVLEGGQGHQADRVIKGGKPLWLMRALVRDYSEPGDLVCDPTAGGATTLLASVIEGRRAIGAERDPETFRKAVARLRRGYTPVLDWGSP